MPPDIESILGRFPMELPVFPLPEVVLFPGAILPLHVFEPRYRTMLSDVLAGDRLLAIALLKRCGPAEYESAPPFHETVCVGQVIHHDALPDGRANIALLGISAGRAALVESAAPYRTARVDLLADTCDVGGDFAGLLARACRHAVSGGDLDGLRVQLSQLLGPDRLQAALVSTCAVSAPILPHDKLGLLEERSVARRLDRLIAFLERPWQWN